MTVSHETSPERRSGTELVCELPDAGPWHMTTFAGRLFTVSEQSGCYEVVDKELRKIELKELP